MGRPKKMFAIEEVAVSVKIPKKQYDVLVRRKIGSGESLATILRRAIENEIEFIIEAEKENLK